MDEPWAIGTLGRRTSQELPYGAGACLASPASIFGTPCDDALPSQENDMKPNWGGHAPTGVSLLQRVPGPYPWRLFTIPKRVAKAAASSRDLTWSLVRMF
jgi:hypothetical protein